MVKIIETNLSIDINDTFRDHQSRVIETGSWQDYINEIKEAKCVSRMSCLGHLDGCTIPKIAKVENLKYDDFHLSCDVINFANQKTKKLAYLIK